MQCLGGSLGHCTSQHRPVPALHMLSFEIFVKSMPPTLSELKITPSFCFAFKIPDDVAASSMYVHVTFTALLLLFVVVRRRLRGAVVCCVNSNSHTPAPTVKPPPWPWTRHNAISAAATLTCNHHRTTTTLALLHYSPSMQSPQNKGGRGVILPLLPNQILAGIDYKPSRFGSQWLIIAP